jgi:hypothetical protein
MMVRGLSEEFHCLQIFNLFCIYGDVMKVAIVVWDSFIELSTTTFRNFRFLSPSYTFQVRFLENYSGSALVEMRTAEQVDKCIRYLNGESIFSGTIAIFRSKTFTTIKVEKQSKPLDDTCKSWDFEGCTLFRFLCADASETREVAPCEVMKLNRIFLGDWTFVSRCLMLNRRCRFTTWTRKFRTKISTLPLRTSPFRIPLA